MSERVYTYIWVNMYLNLSTRFALKTHTWPTTVTRIYLSLISLINHVGMFLFEMRAKYKCTHMHKDTKHLFETKSIFLSAFSFYFVLDFACAFAFRQSIYSLLKSTFLYYHFFFVVFYTFNDFHSILIVATAYTLISNTFFGLYKKHYDKRTKANEEKKLYT